MRQSPVLDAPSCILSPPGSRGSGGAPAARRAAGVQGARRRAWHGGRGVAAGCALALLVGAHAAHAQSFSGTGQHATNFFEWPGGVAVVELAHFGDGEFRVRLIDARGRPVELLADTRGAGELTRAVRIPGGGAFLFDVQASGAWEIRLREGAFREAELVELGLADGRHAARRAGGARWLGLGLAGGVLLGPIGGGGVFALAGSRPPGEPPPLPAGADALGPAYREAYGGAFRDAVAAERRTAALIGGLVGTAANAMLILTWARGRQGDEGDGGTPPPEFNRVPAGFLKITVPWPARS